MNKKHSPFMIMESEGAVSVHLSRWSRRETGNEGKGRGFVGVR